MRESRPRSPPVVERSDGLLTVNCPICRTIWYRMEPAAHRNTHEIRCGRCRNFVRYRVEPLQGAPGPPSELVVTVIE